MRVAQRARSANPVCSSLNMRFFSEERIHSTDIAFKPNESGWGHSSKYSSNFDNIFAKKAEDATSEDPSLQELKQQIMALDPQQRAELFEMCK
jgi:hypothetical protein